MTIKLFALDIDGTLTDDTVSLSSIGGESKSFCYADMNGIGMLQRAGVKVALISAVSNPEGARIVQMYAHKVNVADAYTDCADKALVLCALASKYNIDPDDVAYMGDELCDIPAMQAAGYSFAPASAQAKVRAEADVVTKRAGGHGAVREVVDAILAGDFK